MGDEYIKKEDAVKAVANAYWHGTDCECYAFAHKALDNLPTADVVPREDYEELERHFVNWEPVIRCKDCKHFKSQTENTGVCDGGFCHAPMHVAVIDYCSHVERKDDDKSCDTCKHRDKGWYDASCDGCTKAYSNWERRDDECMERNDDARRSNEYE